MGNSDQRTEPYALCKNFFDPPPGSVEDAARRGLAKCESLEHCAAGHNFAFFYNKEEDIMYGCGANAYGQLGPGMASPIYSMVPCRLGPCSQRKICKIACGSTFTWFLTERDEVLATGSNGFGDLRCSTVAPHHAGKPQCLSFPNWRTRARQASSGWITTRISRCHDLCLSYNSRRLLTPRPRPAG